MLLVSHQTWRPGHTFDEIAALPPTELLEVGFPFIYGKLMDDMQASPSVESDVTMGSFLR